jgi:signal transduction histidine kinase
MASRRSGGLFAGPGLVLCGATGALAWQNGLWGLLTGAVLVAGWIHAHGRLRDPRPLVATTAGDSADPLALLPGLLLDAAPTPMLVLEGGSVRSLNRAARALFGSEDRVAPAPAALLDQGCTRLRQDGRSWRIDRVDMAGSGRPRTLLVLADIDRAERAAEAKVSAELIHVVGHELMNGLAPIVSLAESARAALDGGIGRDPALVAEIVGTLARRAESLQRFVSAYRALARLPDPVFGPVRLRGFADDLARLFAGRWPGVALAIDVPHDLVWSFDRDQLGQATWALLQNAAEAVTADGGTQVWLRVRATEAGLSLEVSDDGGGVPAALSEGIFRPFHSSKPEGTGIGLSLARQVAMAHGGTLSLEPGERTVFRILLPSTDYLTPPDQAGTGAAQG